MKPSKFDASKVAQKIVDYAWNVGMQEPGGAVVEVPRERIRSFADVPRMSARREQKIHTELKKRGCGHMNSNGTALVSTAAGPRVICAAEAEFVYKEVEQEIAMTQALEAAYAADLQSGVDNDRDE